MDRPQSSSGRGRRLQTMNRLPLLSSSSGRSPSTGQPRLSSPSSFQRVLPMDSLPSSSSYSPRLPAVNRPASSLPSSQRLQSFRHISGTHQALLNRTTVFNKKTYVPNLFVSRSVQQKEDTHENVTPLLPKKEFKENRRGRREQKLLAPVETFIPETKSSIIGTNLGSKHVKIDQSVMKKVFSEHLPTNFESISSGPSQDLPIPIPKSRFVPVIKSEKKVDPTLTDIIKFDGGESPLYLLKTPRYIPAALDELKNNSKAEGDDQNQKTAGCTIHDLLEGQIGKLQVLKSGKLRLVLGDCKFWLHKGVKVNFREELAIVRLDSEKENGDIICLGEIKERIMVVPDVVSKLS